MLCPAYTNSLCHLSKLCGLPPIQAVKIPSVSFQSLTSVLRQHIFYLALINKSSFCFHTSQILERDGFPHLGTPCPWGISLNLKTTPNHQHLIIPSHTILPGCWASNLHHVGSAVPLPSSVCHFPSTSGFFSQVPPTFQGRFVERTLKNFITLFKVFLKPLFLPGKLQ